MYYVVTECTLRGVTSYMNINERISGLRKNHGISQEKLSEALRVSRQAVQKWETGTALPDIVNLIELARFFNVSLDYLVGGRDNRETEQQRLHKIAVPEYTKMNDWELYSSNMKTEYRQCIDEGLDAEFLQDIMSSLDKIPKSRYKERIADCVFNIINELDEKPGYKYTEPSDKETIFMLSSPVKRSDFCIGEKELKNKLKGAFMGRAAGCLLGKPVEGIAADDLERFLRQSENYPLSRYIKRSDVTPKTTEGVLFDLESRRDFADMVSCAPCDDDTNYTVLSSIVVDEYGRNFTAADVGAVWIARQTRDAYCTAERVAYKNLINGYLPPDTAAFKNPFREWIGAQIRADYYGYINPGDVKSAADMAFCDASLSHIKNGIYGAMWVAAMIAKAGVSENIREIIDAGLSVIPKTSRFYEHIKRVVAEFDSGLSAKDIKNAVYSRFDVTQWVHTLPNAEIVTAALLIGNGDFEKSICAAVSMGYDTDCNGATVGSVLGMSIGADALPDKWMSVLGDTQDTSIFGVGKIKFDSLVERALKHIKDKKKSE